MTEGALAVRSARKPDVAVFEVCVERRIVLQTCASQQQTQTVLPMLGGRECAEVPSGCGIAETPSRPLRERWAVMEQISKVYRNEAGDGSSPRGIRTLPSTTVYWRLAPSDMSTVTACTPLCRIENRPPLVHVPTATLLWFDVDFRIVP